MAKSKGKKRIRNKLIKNIDTTIQDTCKKINEESVYMERYAETVAALAELVRARDLLY